MADIRYNFIASGQGDVKAAFRDIDAAARASKKAFDDSARSAVAGSKATAAGARSAQRPISETARLAERVAKDQERAAKRVASEQEKASGKAAAAVTKAATATARAAKKAADAEIRETKRAEKEKIRAAEHVFQIHARYSAQQTKLEERRAAAESRAAEHRSRMWGRLGKDIAMSAVGAGFGALGVIGGAAREGMRLQDSSNRLSINARGAGEQGADPTTLRKEFEAAALGAPGVKAADISEGVQGFVAKTGDLASGRRFASTFATTASATGADVQDIANAAADISQKFDIKSIDEMRQALAALTFQGKSGAFELKDAASQFSKMSAAAERFGLSKGVSGLKTLGGLTQIARSATGSPEQAATAVEATFRQLVAESGKLKALGVDVFKKGSTSQTRDIRDVLVDSISKTGGSLPKLQKIFGEEGIRGISPLISTYNEAHNGATGTEAQRTAAGVSALRDALEKAIDAPGDWSEVVKDAAEAQKSSSATLDAAWEQLKAQVGAEVVPAMVKLVDKFSGMEGELDPLIVTFVALAEAAGDVVDFFKFLGLIHPKELTPAEQLKKSKKDLEDFNTANDKKIGPISPEDFAKKAALEAAVVAADAKAYAKVSDPTNGKKMKSMTPDEFAQAYTEASGEKYGTEGRKEDAVYKAHKFALSLQEDPNVFDPGNENAEQKRIREQFSGDVAHDKQQAEWDKSHPNNGSGGDSGAIALNDAAKSLKDAADALKTANRGSITGAPITGGTSP